MQVHGEHARHAHGLQHVGHHLGGDGHAGRTRAAVLAGIAEVRNHGGNALGRCTFERIDHDQQFHQVVVGRGAGGLHHKDFTGPHVLVNFDGNFTVRKAPDMGSA